MGIIGLDIELLRLLRILRNWNIKSSINKWFQKKK